MVTPIPSSTEHPRRRRVDTGVTTSRLPRRPATTTGGVAAVIPDAASGRAFGRSVVSERSRSSASMWAALIAAVGIVALVYFLYAVFTAK
jgi:hypothetical protein